MSILQAWLLELYKAILLLIDLPASYSFYHTSLFLPKIYSFHSFRITLPILETIHLKFWKTCLNSWGASKFPKILRTSVQERHGPIEVSPEEGHKNHSRGGTPLLWGKAERVGAVQPAEDKVPESSCCSLPAPEWGLQESWRGTFYKGMECQDKG